MLLLLAAGSTMLALGCISPPLVFSPTALREAQVSQSYEVTIRVSEAVTPVFEIAIISGALPPGLSFSYEPNTDNVAVIRGTPETAGEFEFVVEALCFGTNRAGQRGQQTYTLLVK